jgi:hypothetical protein
MPSAAGGMRLLLDADLSHRRVGGLLRRRGHDVLAIQTDPRYATLSDSDVLALGESENRIVVTRNGRHFSPLARDWASLGRPHAGLILVWTLQSHQFSAIALRIEDALMSEPEQTRWRNLVRSV